MVDQLSDLYKFEDKRHVSAVLSVAIRHLPNDQAFCEIDYLAQCVMKNKANFVANHVGRLMQQNAEVDQLVAVIEQDGTNQQALDELMKAADHSEYAKEKWEEIKAKIDNGTADTSAF